MSNKSASWPNASSHACPNYSTSKSYLDRGLLTVLLLIDVLHLLVHVLYSVRCQLDPFLRGLQEFALFLTEITLHTLLLKVVKPFQVFTVQEELQSVVVGFPYALNFTAEELQHQVDVTEKYHRGRQYRLLLVFHHHSKSLEHPHLKIQCLVSSVVLNKDFV